MVPDTSRAEGDGEERGMSERLADVGMGPTQREGEGVAGTEEREMNGESVGGGGGEREVKKVRDVLARR